MQEEARKSRELCGPCARSPAEDEAALLISPPQIPPPRAASGSPPQAAAVPSDPCTPAAAPPGPEINEVSPSAGSASHIVGWMSDGAGTVAVAKRATAPAQGAWAESTPAADPDPKERRALQVGRYSSTGAPLLRPLFSNPCTHGAVHLQFALHPRRTLKQPSVDMAPRHCAGGGGSGGGGGGVGRLSRGSAQRPDCRAMFRVGGSLPEGGPHMQSHSKPDQDAGERCGGTAVQGGGVW